ncbi:MAG: hypothetical protein WCX48_07815 [Bacteroidales bacterium]
MKTLGLNISICTLATVLTLSSCLDDQNDSIESGKDLAFITTYNNTKCAATSCGYVTSPEIQTLIQNECYLIGYIITDPAVDGIYTADNTYNVSDDPLPQTVLKEGTPENEQENNSAVDNLTIPFFYPTHYMGDRWMFKYSAILNSNEKLTPRFYYDENNQVDKNGVSIKNENMVVIDVYFEKSVVTGSNPASSGNEYLTIANFESLRTLYNPDYNRGYSTSNEKCVDVQLLFRYHKNRGVDEPSVISYVGDWETSSRVYMTFIYQSFYILGA